MRDEIPVQDRLWTVEVRWIFGAAGAEHGRLTFGDRGGLDVDMGAGRAPRIAAVGQQLALIDVHTLGDAAGHRVDM